MAQYPSTDFPEANLLSYLGLSSGYTPSPAKEPISFLGIYLRQLPLELANRFSSITTAKERTSVTVIRNRRTKFSQSCPSELSFDIAKSTWPMLWGPGDRSGQDQGKDEKEWAEKDFLGGRKMEVGKLGKLLAEYEEDREAERLGTMRRKHYTTMQALTERAEQEEEEDSEDDMETSGHTEEEETEAEAKTTFERRIKELFIYGMLESDLYDSVDWDDQYDSENEREREDRWFDEDDNES